jgi:DNA-binding NarL/FixJ family response regulator
VTTGGSVPGAIRVFVVDDHLVVRAGLRSIIQSEPGFEWVGEAGDGETFLSCLDSARPHVVLMDIRMPGMGGVEALRRAKERTPGIGIVILTTFDEVDLLVAAVRNGANGYLLKDAGRDAILQGIQAAARGDVLFASGVLDTVLAAPARPATEDSPTFTPREEDVLRELANGSSNKRIARRLNIAERTVKAHLTSIYAKLGVKTRTATVAWALQHGLHTDS